MQGWLVLLAVLCVVLLVEGCGDDRGVREATDGGPDLTDAGPSVRDASTDGGASRDAGPQDAGGPDADASTDDASVADSGPPCEVDRGCIPEDWRDIRTTGTGTCTGGATHHTPCSTGCCTSSDRFTILDSAIEYTIITGEDGAPILQPHDYVIDGGEYDVALPEVPWTVNRRFERQPYPFRWSSVALTGRFQALRSAEDGKLNLSFVGDGTSGSGRCGPTEISFRCAWTGP